MQFIRISYQYTRIYQSDVPKQIKNLLESVKRGRISFISCSLKKRSWDEIEMHLPSFRSQILSLLSVCTVTRQNSEFTYAIIALYHHYTINSGSGIFIVVMLVSGPTF